MRDRSLDSLSARFKPLAIELLARLDEALIPVMIIETNRSAVQHEQDVLSGHSWIAVSKHQTGDAIDICPYDTYKLHGDDKLDWDSDDPVWTKIGEIGEKLGLRWGGRWKRRDMGHFEYHDV